jgi:hypothetical protein
MLELLLTLPCIIWLLSAGLALRSIVSVPHLARVDAPEPEQWPTLSVIVPACNEAETLPAAAEKLLAMDYPALQPVFVDDRSSDDTGALVDALAARDERVAAVHVATLPEGWLGKPHAMQRGLDVATGDWLLFTDADVELKPTTLRKAIAWCEAESVDHLTLVPDIEVDGFALQATVAGFSRYFSLGQRIWQVNDDDSSAFLGLGAFNLVRRTALERTEGLPWLAMDTTDDLALGMLLKQSGARCRVMWGMGCVGVRWYTSLRGMIVGLEKNTYPMAGCRLWPLALMALLVLALDTLPFAILLMPGLPDWLFVTALATLAVCLPLGALMSRWTSRPMLPGLAVPLGGALIAYIMLRAGILGARRGGVNWRGTFYSSDVLRRGARVSMF